MAEIATAWVQIVPSARGMAANLEREITPAATKAGDTAGKGFASRFEAQTGKSLGDFGKGALIAAGALGLGLTGVTKAAGGLSAALSANNQVLGDSSKAVQEFADNSVEAVGLSERATLQAATAFGQLGKVAGLTGDPLAAFSVDMVKLAADMAAFADVPADQAVQDLRAAFAGSTETVQKYNIFLNETELKAALFRSTGEKVTGVLTAQQRVLATQAALLEQTADIQGQAAREAGGYQRAEDNLRATLENTAASIGESTLPAMTGLLTVLASGVGGVGDLNDATGGLIAGLLVVGTTALGAGGSIAFAADKVSKGVSAFKNMSGAAQTASVATAGIAAAAVAGFLIYDRWRQKQEEIRARTTEVAAALRDQVRETWATAEASAGAAGEVDGLAVAQRALSAALTSTGDDGQRLTEALGALGVSADDALGVLTGAARDSGAELRSLAEAAGLTSAEAEFVAIVADSGSEGLRNFAFNSQATSFALRSLNGDLAAAAEELGATKDQAAATSPEMVRITDALIEIRDQARNTDLDAMADSFLNAAAAGSGLSKEAQTLSADLVEQARAQATAADGTYDALAAYEAYNVLLADLPDRQRDLVTGVEEAAPAIDTAATALSGFNSVAASTIEVASGAERAFDRAESQASAFSDAIDRLVGSQLDLQSSGDRLLDGFASIAQVVTDTAAGVEGASTSLDAFSDAGRANRELVRGQVEQILNYSRAMIDAGSSVDEASASALANTETLRDQLVAFGLTKDEANAYLAELGLTPASVETAVELYNAEAAKLRVEELVDQLDQIPEAKRSEIQALIDEGDYAEAERRLAFLVRDRYVPIRPNSGTAGNAYFADGAAYIDRPTPGVFGEAGAESILPLENDRRMREILSDPRVFGPVVSALPRIPVDVSGSSPRSVVGMHVENQYIASGLDLDTAARLLTLELEGV